MDVTWLGGSCIRLQSGAGSVLTDPFDLSATGSALAADVVTLSLRGARDRLHVDGPHRLVAGPGEYEIKGIPVTGVATRRRGTDDQDAGARNFVYSIQMDGVMACHLGRLNRPPSAQEVQELGAPDVLFVPLGEPEGLSVQHAITLTSQLEAKLLVPLLLGGPDDRAALERFCRELGSDPSNPEPRLSVSASGLPATTRVVVLAATLPAPPGG
jgi:L-ascorbate metabolism protein UlaG (beta-lactamase superfamily)